MISCESSCNYYYNVDFRPRYHKLLLHFKYILLTKTTAVQNEAALSYHRLPRLYFLAVVFVRRVVYNGFHSRVVLAFMLNLQKFFWFFHSIMILSVLANSLFIDKFIYFANTIISVKENGPFSTLQRALTSNSKVGLVTY